MTRASLLLLLLFSVLQTERMEAPLSPDVWRTDLSKHSIDLSELRAEGPAKDGIPALHRPHFQSLSEAEKWLAPGEPVIVVEHAGEVRAYPLQILLWHELVNDQIGALPVLVSYCPLCNSAVVFDRSVNGTAHSFGVAGFLRHNDMVMYDQQTDSLWQQLTGEGIVGTHTGQRLTPVTSRVITFSAFQAAYSSGKVLSRQTGYFPRYGESTYTGYEFGNMPRGSAASPLRSGEKLERVLMVENGGNRRAYRFRFLKSLGVAEDRLGDLNYVIFYEPEGLTPLDAKTIAESRSVGTAAAYLTTLNGERLRFRRKNGKLIDRATGSVWSVTGIATDGPLKGTRLKPVTQMVGFEFAVRHFYPKAELVGR